MKKIYTTSILLLASLCTWAQSFTAIGPKTIFNLPALGVAGHYTFFNFETGKEIPLSDSATANWNIAFKGTTILLNGGTSGPSNVTGQVLTSSTFNTLSTAPSSGYNTDGTSKAIPTGSGNGWYNYNYIPADGGPHSITAFTDRIVVVKLSNGNYVKLEILNYYQGAPLSIPTTGGPYAGVGKYYTFRYLVASTSDLSNRITKLSNLYANLSGNHYQFFNLASADTLATTDSNSTKWDIAFKGTTILVNSGISGPDMDSAQVVLVDFNNVLVAPSTDWRSDNASTKAIVTGSGNGWYNYNSSTNIITPLTGRTIVLKLSNGRYVKIQIESYYKDAPTSILGSEPARYYTFSYEYVPNGSTALTATIATSTTALVRTNLSESFITIFPVPFSGSDLNISWASHLAVQKIKIMNAKGLILLEKNINDSQNAIQLGNLSLSKGLYIVSLEGTELNETKKIIVE